MQPCLGLNRRGRDMFRIYRTCVVALTFVISMAPGSSLLANELTAADYREIEELYGKYAAALDSGDGDAYANTYTEDGSFRVDRDGLAGTPTIGRDALVTFAERYHAGNQGDGRHWNNAVAISATADGATGSAYLVLSNVRSRGISVTGIYRDVLKKTNRGWRFASRVVEADTPADQSVAVAELTEDDHAEIRQLYGKYVWAFDLGDPMAYADTYTPDGFIRVDRADARGIPTVGHDNLAAFAKRYHETNGPYPRHWNSGLVITPTADGAHGTCYLVVFNVNTRDVMLTGRYQDTLKKTAEGWRFAKREFLIDPVAEGDE